MHKRSIAIIISLAAAVLFFSGCATNSGSDEDRPRDELVFASTMSTSSIDPANGYSGWFTLRYGVGETLFKLDESMTPQPWLAENYELIDETTWKITLKEGITFHNGKDVTAESVKASLERLVQVNDRAPSTLRISEIEADGNQIIVKTSEANPTLINGLCDPFASIIDVDAGTDFDTKVIGTGPYMVERFMPQADSTVIKHENYWNGEPKLKRVTIKPISDGDTMTMALQSGEIDATQGMPYSSHKIFSEDEDYKISSESTSRVFMIYYNYETPMLSDENVRKAISMSIDKKNYAEVLLSGSAKPATGAFPQSLPYGGDRVTADGYDLEGARKLLENSGYKDENGDGILEKDGEKLRLKLVTYSSRVELPVLAQAIQSQLKELGIEVDVEVSEDVNDRLKAGDFDLAAYAYVTSPTGDPLAYLDYVFKTEGVSNFGNFSNEKVDSMIEELRGEFDFQKRYELAKEIQQVALDETAFTFMAHLDMAFVMKNDVEGLEVHPTDYYQINVDTDIR